MDLKTKTQAALINICNHMTSRLNNAKLYTPKKMQILYIYPKYIYCMSIRYELVSYTKHSKDQQFIQVQSCAKVKTT